MDLNCGIVAEGSKTVVEAGQWIFETIFETASGIKTRSGEL